MRAASSIARMDDRQVARAQARELGHNRLVDLVLGGVAPHCVLTDGTVAGGSAEIPMRIYRPDHDVETARPLVINLHGGGWVLGGLNEYDWLCSNVATAVDAVVVSLQYRLAPTHPWPAASEDCYAALLDLVRRAPELGADVDRLAVMGDSAGGNLAAVLTLMCRDRSGPSIAFQALMYPVTDLTFGSPSIEENAEAPILSKAELLAFGKHYLQEASPSDPYVSPLLATGHRDLPPALIQVAEHDPVRDDGVRYAQALSASGVATRLTTYVGMPHGFLSLPRLCRSATQGLAELCEALHEAVGR